MKDDPVARKALDTAERGVSADASRLVAAVPALMREAERRRRERGSAAPSLGQFAGAALPRLAAATAIAVIAAAWLLVRDSNEPAPSAAPTSFESVIVGGGADGTGDVVFDALLDVRRSDG
jgi:hypothetical protein